MEDDKFSIEQYTRLATRLHDERDPAVRLEAMQQMLRFEFEWASSALEDVPTDTQAAFDIRERILRPLRDIGHQLMLVAKAAKELNVP